MTARPITRPRPAVADDRAASDHDFRRLADRDPRADAHQHPPRYDEFAAAARLDGRAVGRHVVSAGSSRTSASGAVPVINISGGTEIVGCFLFPLPIQPLKVCTLGGPAPGMATEVVDEDGAPVRGRTGYLVCTKPAPSMTRGIWGDPKRYIETYWSRWPALESRRLGERG